MKVLMFLLFFLGSQQSYATEFNTSMSVMARPGLTARGAFGYQNWYFGLGPSRYTYRDEIGKQQYEIGSLGTLGYQNHFQFRDQYALEFKSFVGAERFRDRTTPNQVVHQVGVVGTELGILTFSQIMPPKYPSVPTLGLSSGLGLEARLLKSGRIHAGDSRIAPLAIYFYISTIGIFSSSN